MFKNVIGIGVAVLLIAGLGYQLFGTAQYLNSQFQNKFWANRNLDAFVRSADDSYGGDFAAYISFLRHSIPENAAVLIPPKASSVFSLNDQFLMQYLLFPRAIVVCSSDCTGQLANPATFILAQNDFPPSGSVSPTRQLIQFTNSLGLYLPMK